MGSVKRMDKLSAKRSENSLIPVPPKEARARSKEDGRRQYRRNHQGALCATFKCADFRRMNSLRLSNGITVRSPLSFIRHLQNKRPPWLVKLENQIFAKPVAQATSNAGCGKSRTRGCQRSFPLADARYGGDEGLYCALSYREKSLRQEQPS